MIWGFACAARQSHDFGRDIVFAAAIFAVWMFADAMKNGYKADEERYAAGISGFGAGLLLAIAAGGYQTIWLLTLGEVVSALVFGIMTLAYCITLPELWEEPSWIPFPLSGVFA